ncbi:MAG: pseudouridine synthase [Gammaproteobacteria bacterium]
MTDGVRINKALAQSGVASRREVERLINAGRITVNGKEAVLGQRLVATDEVELDEKPIELKLEASGGHVIMYNKPVGQVCTRSDPEGRTTVFSKLPEPPSGRWISVGRLDINTSGLLLFTTDGDLANRLMHPSSQVEREYAVRVLGDLSAESMQILLKGVELDDGMARFTDIQAGGGEGANQWYYVVLTEGRQREVRRLFEAVGSRVSRLIRVRYGNVIMERDMGAGRTRPLTDSQMSGLHKAAKGPTQRRPRKPRHPRKKHDRK